MRVLSFGAGVNSVALLILRKLGKIEFDYVVFADTGAEHPETYEYIEKVCIPLCKEIGIPFVRVGSPTLYEDYYKKQIIPFRMFRSCTDRYKITPIRKWIQENLGEATILLGIDIGEKERAKDSQFIYPLIEMDINRDSCKLIIAENGYPIPRKSGCFFCPFTPFEGWKNLYDQHPWLYERAEAFERNCRKYPMYHLTDMRLSTLRQLLQKRDPESLKKFTQKPLLEWANQPAEACVFCHE